MCRKGIFLISFVLMLGLSDNVKSEDLNPPGFAGAKGWCAAVWEFDIEPPEPTEAPKIDLSGLENVIQEFLNQKKETACMLCQVQNLD